MIRAGFCLSISLLFIQAWFRTPISMMTEKSTRIHEMLKLGAKYPEITKATGAASSTIAYHAEKLGLRKNSFVKPSYNWTELQKYYDIGFSVSEVAEMFSVKHSALRDARLRGVLIMDPRRKRMVPQKRIPDHLIFARNSSVSFPTVKRRFNQLVRYMCSNAACPLHKMSPPVWANKPIVLHLDHINGDRSDQTFGNLRWLCPNCHSQTETYCGRNKGGASGRDRTDDLGI